MTIDHYTNNEDAFTIRTLKKQLIVNKELTEDSRTPSYVNSPGPTRRAMTVAEVIRHRVSITNNIANGKLQHFNNIQPIGRVSIDSLILL